MYHYGYIGGSMGLCRNVIFAGLAFILGTGAQAGLKIRAKPPVRIESVADAGDLFIYYDQFKLMPGEQQREYLGAIREFMVNTETPSKKSFVTLLLESLQQPVWAAGCDGEYWKGKWTSRAELLNNRIDPGCVPALREWMSQNSTRISDCKTLSGGVMSCTIDKKQIVIGTTALDKDTTEMLLKKKPADWKTDDLVLYKGKPIDKIRCVHSGFAVDGDREKNPEGKCEARDKLPDDYKGFESKDCALPPGAKKKPSVCNPVAFCGSSGQKGTKALCVGRTSNSSRACDDMAKIEEKNMGREKYLAQCRDILKQNPKQFDDLIATVNKHCKPTQGKKGYESAATSPVGEQNRGDFKRTCRVLIQRLASLKEIVEFKGGAIQKRSDWERAQ